MREQDRVAAFVERHDVGAPPAYRLLDLVAEVGEVATDAVESTEYGAEPESLAVSRDEIGDALFALLALADSLDVDAGDALDESIEKYADRVVETGDPSSAGDDPG